MLSGDVPAGSKPDFANCGSRRRLCTPTAVGKSPFVTSVGVTDARCVATLRVKTGRLLTRPTPHSLLRRPIVEVSSRSVPVDMLDRRFMPPSNLIFGKLENGSHAIPFIRTWRILTQYNGKTTLLIKARLSRQFVGGYFAYFAQVVYASLVTHIDAFISWSICES
jgi:hypothetical protein